jgi:hypothetical protein
MYIILRIFFVKNFYDIYYRIFMISKITNELLDSLIIECKKEKNIDKLKINILNPIIYYIFWKIYPFFIILFIILLVILIIIIIMLVLLIK